MRTEGRRARPFRAAARRAFTRRRVVVGLGLAAGLWLVLVAWQLLLARAEADQARQLLQRAQAELDVDALLDGGEELRLREAQRLFEDAAARAGSPLLAPFRHAPFVGRQLDAFESLARSAGDVVAVGLDGLGTARRAIDEFAPGDELAVAAQLVATVHDAQARLDGIDLGPSEHLLGPLADARAEVATELDELRATVDDAVATADGVLALLDGDSRYLLLAANNAEMRAGSGMFLSAGELTIRDGSFELGPMEPAASLFLPEGAVSTARFDDLEDRWGWLHPSQEWRNLNLTPRFDVSAELAADMWVAAGGRPVDGVLAVDVVALQALLAATGPVELDGVRIDADTVVDEVLLEQYRRYPDIVDRDERRDALGRLAAAALDGLDRRRFDIRALVRGLADAIDGRHVLAWSDGDDAELWEAAGADGRLDANSLVVSVLNRGGNKLDQFLAVASDIQLDPVAEGRRTVTVRVALRHRPPADLPAYVAGPHPNSDLEAREYGGIVTVNVPGSAENVRLRTDRGDAPLAVAGPDGPTVVVGVPVQLSPGDDEVVTVTFDVPATVTLDIVPTARVPDVTTDVRTT